MQGRDEASLLSAVLADDQRAWREFVRRYEGRLRESVRELMEPVDRTTAEVDDVIAEFWLRMIDGEKRWLRAFNPTHVASLESWLLIHVAHVAHEHIRRLRLHRKRTVPIDEARHVPSATSYPSSVAVPIGSIDEAIRGALREVVREEIQLLWREVSGAARAPSSATASDYLSITDASRVAGVHPATLRGWIRERRLPGHRAGRHHRVKRSELEAFMASVCDGSPTVDMDARAAELASA